MKKKDNMFKKKKIENGLNLAQEEDVHNKFVIVKLGKVFQKSV